MAYICKNTRQCNKQQQIQYNIIQYTSNFRQNNGTSKNKNWKLKNIVI